MCFQTMTHNITEEIEASSSNLQKTNSSSDRYDSQYLM